MYMNIYIQESRSTIGPLPILGMQVYLQYIVVLVSIGISASFVRLLSTRTRTRDGRGGDVGSR